ncbi:DUF6262 family protein [Streptomyces sp. H27-G5]|uniref:DUF6262 family protein n=1 Tax=Streptomyces sp. H27-G5 TaxID=2996698 RepID=UPI0022702F9A|nr:DUF6262 family protein [Streptomyces sp. H27-G5]MCY0924499.1 DUF6262 family protein [Streptomyces sp. H27-G5]
MSNTESLADARHQDSERRRAKVLAAIDRLATQGDDLSVSSVSRAAGVHRSLIYRHPDLHAAVTARASEPQVNSLTGPGASKQSLLTDIANLTDRVRRQDAHIRQLESRLAEALGEQVWQRAGLGGPPDHDALQKQVNHLEQHVTELQRQVADRDDDLDAARAANRQLMAKLNTSRE